MTDTDNTEKRPYRATPEVQFETFDAESLGLTFTREPRKGSGERARSEYQAQIDDQVATAYASGKPLFFLVEPTVQAVDDMKKRVRNSADYLKLGLQTGKTVKHPQTGQAVVSFMVKDRIARPRKEKSE